jgi:hypothetical protein
MHDQQQAERVSDAIVMRMRLSRLVPRSMMVLVVCVRLRTLCLLALDVQHAIITHIHLDILLIETGHLSGHHIFILLLLDVDSCAYDLTRSKRRLNGARSRLLGELSLATSTTTSLLPTAGDTHILHLRLLCTLTTTLTTAALQLTTADATNTATGRQQRKIQNVSIISTKRNNKQAHNMSQ